MLVSVKKEMSIMGSLVHPHIIRLYELIETQKRWYAVMEYGEVGFRAV
jgi:serine/threonine protein kinase